MLFTTSQLASKRFVGANEIHGLDTAPNRALKLAVKTKSECFIRALTMRGRRSFSCSVVEAKKFTAGNQSSYRLGFVKLIYDQCSRCGF